LLRLIVNQECSLAIIIILQLFKLFIQIQIFTNVYIIPLLKLIKILILFLTNIIFNI